MSITKKIHATFAMLAAIALAACQGTPVRLGDGAVYVQNANAPALEAKACGFQLLLLIPISNNTRHMRAWNSLKAQAYGKPLTNVQVKEAWFWAGVGTIYCTTLSATVGDRVATVSSRVTAVPEPVLTPTPVTTPEAVVSPAAMPEPAAAGPAPRAAPVSARVPVPVVSGTSAAQPQARAKDGASLRSAPALVSAGARVLTIVSAGAPVILKQKIANGSGVWWFVSVEAKGEGWIRESELDLIKL